MTRTSIEDKQRAADLFSDPNRPLQRIIQNGPYGDPAENTAWKMLDHLLSSDDRIDPKTLEVKTAGRTT